MDDHRRINIAYARYIEDVVPTPWLHDMATWTGTLDVLTVRAPDGWDLASMDALDPDTYSRIERVFKALRDKEDSFRRKPAAAESGSGEGSGADHPVVVPQAVAAAGA